MTRLAREALALIVVSAFVCAVCALAVAAEPFAINAAG